MNDPIPNPPSKSNPIPDATEAVTKQDMNEKILSTVAQTNFSKVATPIPFNSETHGAGLLPPRYVDHGEIGGGGMGIVHKAWDVQLNRFVAIKRIRSGSNAHPIEIIRFLGEAQKIAALSHPNIIKVFDIGKHNGSPYFTLEYVEGGSLSGRLKRDKIPIREAAEWMEQIALGVDHAHQNGIIHRDLKPGNVLLALKNEKPCSANQESLTLDLDSPAIPKITDFGIAKSLELGEDLTQSLQVMGTPAYMPPEQARGDSHLVDSRSDVYSSGAIFYQMLTQKIPFEGKTEAEIRHRVLFMPPKSLLEWNPEVPKDLETICLKCLEKDPADRYPSSLALAEDLRRYLDGIPIKARPVPWYVHASKWLKRNAVVAGLVNALLALLTVLIYVFATRPDPKPTEPRSISPNPITVPETEFEQRLEELRRSLDGPQPDFPRFFKHQLTPAIKNAPQIQATVQQLIEKAAGSYATWYGQNSPLHHLLFSPDGKWLLSSDNTKHGTRIIRWNTATGRNQWETQVQSRSRFNKTEVDPDGKQLTARRMSFTPDSLHLAIINANRIEVYSLTGDQKEALIIEPFVLANPNLTEEQSQRNIVDSLVFSADGKTIYCFGRPGIDSPSDLFVLDWKQKLLKQMPISLGTLRISDAILWGQTNQILARHFPKASEVKVNDPQAKNAKDKRTLIRINLTDFEPQPIDLPGPDEIPFDYSSLAACADGKTIAAVIQDQIWIWTEENGHFKAEEPIRNDGWFTSNVSPEELRNRCIRFHPSGRYLVLSSVDAWFWILDRERKSLRRLHGRHNGKAIDFSPDGQILATGSHDGDATIKLWDVRQPQWVGPSLIEFQGATLDPLTKKRLEFETLYYDPAKIYEDPQFPAILIPCPKEQAFWTKQSAFDPVWHESQFVRYQSQSNRFAARFHLQQFMKHDPQNPRWKKEAESLAK